ELLMAASEGENPDVRACRKLHYRPPEGAGAAARAARLRRALRLPRGFSFRRLREHAPRPGWERSGKAFDAASVQRWTDAVAAARGGAPGPAVRPAAAAGAYRVPFGAGRAVEVRYG
ncbi:MAG TPA: hypothetical protein VJG13_14305, partial [Thermoanaerobaculia bacterium]|nr:hypothetical protein [Thermoanaerobaculia bacterium]